MQNAMDGACDFERVTTLGVQGGNTLLACVATTGAIMRVAGVGWLQLPLEGVP